jgi:hypothetical protein
LLPFAIFLGVAFLAVAYVAYVLWPRWPAPAVSANAPSLPIVIAGVTFNVPPAAIRFRTQRRPGAQDRVDLVFLWPSLAAPDSAADAADTGPAATAKSLDRLFVTLAASAGELPPLQRMQDIYPRYMETEPAPGPDGLIVRAFRNDTPYHGEDLLYPAGTPQHFFLRCSRNASPTPGTCLYEKRVGEADVTVRFPRNWLDDWRNVIAGIDQLIEKLRPQRN